MTSPPVFTSEQGKWSIGSEVVAFWWETRAGVATQMHDVGIVARLHRRGVLWIATVTFGPVWDLLRPTEFESGDLLAAAPYDPDAASEAWTQNGGGLVR